MNLRALWINPTIAEAARQLNAAREVGLDIVRVYLGVALLVRGVMWIAAPDVLLGYVQRTGSWFGVAAVAHYVIAAHVCGGLMLLLGFYTRLAAVVQLPALIGAVFAAHWSDGLMASGQSLELSALVLFMLLVFCFFGAGPLSLDRAMRVAAKKETVLHATTSLGSRPHNEAVLADWEGEGGSVRPGPYERIAF